MAVHRVAHEGFGREAATYDRSRPTYPTEAVAWLVEHLRIGPRATVVDLAAGTGKLTRLLLPTGAAVVAVEPVEGMRDVLARGAGVGVMVAAGVAEVLPLRAGSLDAVTVAQAFHWFDEAAAYREVARVLRPGGRLGTIWNSRDRGVEWVDRVWAVMDRVESDAPWRTDAADERRRRAGPAGPFGPFHRFAVDHGQRLTPAGVVDRMRSVSHIAALPAPERDAVLAEVAALLAEHPATRGRAELVVPYRAECAWCERR